MRRLTICILMIAPVFIWACQRKGNHNQIDGARKDIVCLVTDTAQSLIGEAKIEFSDNTKSLTTGWDGCFRFTPQRKEVKVSISAEGYLKKSITIHASDTNEVQIIVLKSDPKAEKHDPFLMHKGSLRGAKGLGRAVKSKEAVYMSSIAEADEYVAPAMADMAVAEEAEVITTEDHAAGVATNNIQAGKLTAGEVNDFAKWALWGDILNNSHKEYVKDWNIRAEKRYMVQVVNQQGAPVVNRQVLLTDEKGNTLFQARTDNTGRAELWDELYQTHDTKTLYIGVAGKQIKATAFEQGINAVTLDEDCEEMNEADVFFIMDATGSMGDELRYLQAEMKDVIRRSQSAVEGLKIRTGALVYRDHGDEYITRISRLTDQIETTQQFIDKQQAGGGGDYEEAIPEALMASINAAGWNDEARTRIAFLVLDAPCHKDSATLALLHEQILNAAAHGIRLVPIVCSGLQGSGELLMRSMALITNGTSFFLTDDSGIGETHLKPTTDSLKVEHLNDMMVRTIISFCSMPQCEDATAIHSEEIEPFLPNPTDDVNNPMSPTLSTQEVMEIRPNPCHVSAQVILKRDVQQLFLVDISGKTIRNLGARSAGNHTLDVSRLSVGVYFVRAYCQGRWITAKIIVN